MFQFSRVRAAALAGLLTVVSLGGSAALGSLPANAAGLDVTAIEGAQSTDVVCWVVDACDPTAGAPLVESQTYTYHTVASTAGCVDVGTTALSATGSPVDASCSATSTGRYINLACGTGLVFGSRLNALEAVAPMQAGDTDPGDSTATIFANNNFSGASVAGNDLNVVFVAGLGVLFAETGSVAAGAGAPVVGVVQISPQGLPPLPIAPNPSAKGGGACVNGFNVQSVTVAAA